MKKKIMAVVAALAIMTVGTTAFAAGSPTANSTDVGTKDSAVAAEVTAEKPAETPAAMAKATSAEATAADGTKIEIVSNAVSDTTVTETVKAAQAAVNKLTDLASTLGSETLKTAAADSTKKVTAKVAAVVNLEVKNGSINSKTTITIKNDVIEAGKTYAILHYTNGKWETIKADNVKKGSLDITVTSLSPVAIVEVAVSDAEETAATDTTATTAAATTEATTAASTDAGTSPKTGETTPVALFALLACVAGALACSKKSEKN
jgi:hypothetical protein